ncbi:Inner-membrane translocator [Nostocoides japonicum T1-X7]|uniref:Inner-membrane translocator n=1 Tax=Nostocoides japonicum T1-X7 TaxID=1194083 RepID=A0A077LZU9_9MICO|nr:ABC transporter permease [Tetrasphaera japonica]CCH77474.1 Inner-membrane translocator [Tetrasphaera japonica T1-X7]
MTITDDTATTPSTDRPARSTAWGNTLGRFGILVAVVALFIILSLTTPGFFSGLNLRNLLDQQAPILIAAAPLTLVLIAGQFDVSLSAVYITAPLVGLQVESHTGSIALAVLAGLVAGLAAGAFNALLVVICRINSFISTLAASYIIAGIGYLVSDQAILTPSSPGFRGFAATRVLGLSTATLMAVVVIAVCWVLLALTRYGRYVYATGANAEAAKVSGVRTRWIVASTFLLTGAAAGFAGMVNASQSMSAQATDDFSFVFAALAAVVVGGTSIAGGAGAVWRTVAGALFIAMMNNGFNLNQVDPIYQRIILGLVILGAVGIDALTRSRNAT